VDIDFACTFTYTPVMTAYSAPYYGVLFRTSALKYGRPKAQAMVDSEWVACEQVSSAGM